ncbi:hypothetical protein HID58_038805, partial [Brassica napus]
MRQTATERIRILPGNGNSIFFWTTPWSPFGQLIKFVGHNGPRHYGIPLSSSLASLWVGDSWAIGPARSQEMEQVQVFLSTVTLSDHEDTPEWSNVGDNRLRYLTILAWQTLIHELWRERNNRLHRSHFKSQEAILSTISSTIKNRLSSLRESDPIESSASMQLCLSKTREGQDSRWTILLKVMIHMGLRMILLTFPSRA